MYDSFVVLPVSSATFAATTLREYAIQSSNVTQPIPLRSELSIFARPSSSLRVPTSLIFVAGVTAPVSMPAIAVSILNTEPGS